MTLRLALLAALAFSACKEGKSRTELALEALEKKNAEAKLAAKAEKLAPLPVNVVRLDPPWSDEGSERITADAKCPEGLWALFGGQAPGDTKEDQKANAAKRKELAAAAKARRYLVKFRSGGGVTLKPFDAPKGHFPLELKGSVDCTDDIGSITIAWTAAKAVDPGASAAKEGADVTQNIWEAPPKVFEVPMKTQLEAKEFNDTQRLALTARVVFTLGPVSVDKKLKKMAKVAEEAAGEKLSFGGGVEDWGAGRLIRAELVGIRVATDGEKKQLLEERAQP